MAQHVGVMLAPMGRMGYAPACRRAPWAGWAMGPWARGHAAGRRGAGPGFGAPGLSMGHMGRLGIALKIAPPKNVYISTYLYISFRKQTVDL